MAGDARPWMADVGFGVGILGPVPVPGAPGPGEPVRYGRWVQRADRLDDGRILLLEREQDGWRPLHTTFDEPLDDAAIDEANRWVALQPGSPFAGRLVAMRTTDERRERLIGTRLEVTGADGSTETSALTPGGALDVLERRFRGVVDDRERAALTRLLGDEPVREEHGADERRGHPSRRDAARARPHLVADRG